MLLGVALISALYGHTRGYKSDLKYRTKLYAEGRTVAGVVLEMHRPIRTGQYREITYCSCGHGNENPSFRHPYPVSRWGQHLLEVYDTEIEERS